MQHLASTNSLGIMAGLVLGKPIGVLMFCGLAIAGGICRLPSDLKWRHIFGAGILGGIGFTMSIFITNLAFPGDPSSINASKMAILLASITAGISGFLWLLIFGSSKTQNDGPADTM
jgi:NhaA family Na+:H+ antiporter